MGEAPAPPSPTAPAKPGTRPATPTLGVPGAVAGDPNTAARFDGTNDAASAALNLSGTTTLTVEFWMKWNGYANDDRLAMEFTPNFNDNAGGFLVDPNGRARQLRRRHRQRRLAQQRLLRPAERRPWHHYAFVLDTTAPAAEQITPYVDGQPVAYTKATSGTGARPSPTRRSTSCRAPAQPCSAPATSTRWRSTTARSAPATIAGHYAGNAPTNAPSRPSPRPWPAKAGETVSFNASASSDPDGTIAKYEWDLDGNGSYETNTGTTPTTSHTYSTAGNVEVGLRVTDNGGATATTTKTSRRSRRRRWRRTDDLRQAVLATPGLIDYWRLGEASGTLSPTASGPARRPPPANRPSASPARPQRPDTAASFDGANDAASAAVNLSGTTTITVEFWMKWNAYANDDDLAMEFTPNFNEAPAASWSTPTAATATSASRSAAAARATTPSSPGPAPAPGTTTPSSSTPRRPPPSRSSPTSTAKPVAYSKADSGTGAGNFANSTLYFMSRAGSALFGTGDLDEVALYNRALSPATIAAHYALAAHNNPPEASFTASPNPALTNATVSFNASASNDPDGTIAKYEWDLDGNGTYETNTGTTPTTTSTYAIRRRPHDRPAGDRQRRRHGDDDADR